MIEVIDGGFFTSIQDQGRSGSRHLGVPVSGAMDPKAFSMALALLPHEKDCNVWECTLIGPTLHLHENIRFVVTGGSIEIFLNDAPLEMFRVYNAPAGSILKLGKVKKGVRAYLRFQAELILPKYLGSSSFYPPITATSCIKKGDNFHVISSTISDHNPARVRFDTSYIKTTALAVVPGPDWDKLSPKEQEKIETQTFPVLAQNRMGYRLKGNLMAHDATLLSQLVLPGRVQLTPSGELLVATADCQVTGGYLQIFQLTHNALATLVQKREGEQLTFRNIHH